VGEIAPIRQVMVLALGFFSKVVIATMAPWC